MHEKEDATDSYTAHRDENRESSDTDSCDSEVCPTCGGPITAIVGRGPSTQEILPCGHDVGPLTARDLAGDEDSRDTRGRLIADGGEDLPDFEALTDRYGEEAVESHPDGFHSAPPEAFGERRDPVPDPADACVECGSDAPNFRCRGCGGPLCHKHAELAADCGGEGHHD